MLVWGASAIRLGIKDSISHLASLSSEQRALYDYVSHLVI